MSLGDVVAGRYRVERVLGQGGMGVVMAARHLHLGNQVAIKLLRRDALVDAAARERFLREGRATAALRGEHVARVYDLGFLDAGDPFLVFELLDGCDLGALLRAHGPPPIEVAVGYVLQACEGLAEAHAQGIVHRDVKPGNLFLARRADGSELVKVIDFGIAKHTPAAATAAAGEQLTSTFAVLGTALYMAPEQMRSARAADARSDIWALGAVLYRLLSGAPPFPGQSLLDVCAAIQRGPAPLAEARPGTPPELEAAVLRCLREDPSERPPDVAALAAALAPFAPHEGQAAERVARTLRAGGGPAPAATPALRNPPSGARAAAPPEVASAPAAPPPAGPSPATASGAAARAAPTVARANAPGPHTASRSSALGAHTVSRANAPPARTISRAEAPEIKVHPPLIARQAALSALAHAADRIADGARFVVITGPLGLGRTRVLQAGIDAAGLPAERVLRGSCSPERRSPLRPLRRALDTLPPGGRAALAQLSDAVDRALAPAALPSAGDADSALEGVEAALLRAAAEPLLLALDDLQWADPTTLRLLSLLAEQAAGGDPARLLVLAAARNEPSPSPKLRALLGAVRSRIRPGIKHLALERLDEPDSERLAHAIAPLSPELARAVAQGSGGVPFFAVHALLAWRETGAITWRDGVLHAAGGRALDEQVPGVAELVEDRLASYFEPGSDAERAGLRALAAIALYGGGLGVEVLYRVVASDDLLESAVHAWVEAGMLTVSGEPPEIGFGQEMVRQAVLGVARKRPWFPRLHRALLDAIAEGPGAAADAAFLAAGYEKLGAVASARAWLRRAMDAAFAAGLFEEAAGLGDRLAAMTDDPCERAAIELDVVRVLLRGRAFEEARQRLERPGAAASALAPASAAGLRRRIYRLEVSRGLHEASAGDEPLLADADALGDERLRCEARMALAGVARGPRAMALAGEAVELSARCDPGLELSARVLRFELDYAADRCDLELADADLKRALELSAASASVWRQIEIDGDLAVVEAELGRLAAAIERLYGLVSRAERYGMRAQRRLLLQNLAAFLLRAGRAAEAADVAERAAALSTEAGDPALRGVALSLRAEALRRCGEAGAALRCANEAVELQEGRGDAMLSLTLLRRAELLASMGMSSEALADARAARRVAEQHRERDRVLCADLWETLHLARRGAAPPEEVARALAEALAADVTLRELTQKLMDEARTWLGQRPEPAATG
ncbi:protein kinase [Sorangium sp. So ce375]|uniref:serine/threonine-protein kinase n=1 Tax=Sorangium sp. So ce375 TaxID=3133306 RepID=UPI003F5C6300